MCSIMNGHLVRLWHWWCCQRWFLLFCASNLMHALPWIFRSTQLAKKVTKMPILSFSSFLTLSGLRCWSRLLGGLIWSRLTTPITVWQECVLLCSTLPNYAPIFIKAIHFYSGVCPILYCHRCVLFSFALNHPFLSNEKVSIRNHVFEHEQSNQICHVLL